MTWMLVFKILVLAFWLGGIIVFWNWVWAERF